MLLALILMLSAVPLAGAEGTTAPDQNTCVHQWSNWAVTVPATCKSEGTQVRTCTLCQKVETQTIAKSTTHSYKVTSDTATCAAPGIKTQVCSVCGNTVTSTSPATGSHNWTKTTATAATCTANGVQYYICSVCGQTKSETIAAMGHIDSNGDGICERCGAGSGAQVAVVFYTLSGVSTQTVVLGRYPAVPATPATVVSGGKTYTFVGWTQTYTSDYLYTNQRLVTPSGIQINSAGYVFYALYTTTGSTQSPYTVQPGGTKYFSSDDFVGGLGSLWYVEFEVSSSAFSAFTGSVCLNNRQLGRDELTGYRFYYASSSYGDFPLENLYLTAPVNARNSSMTLSYTAFGRNGAASGTVTLAVGNGAAAGSIVKEVSPGGQLQLDGDDFNDFFRRSYPGYTLQYLVFAQPSVSAFDDLSLYYQYGSWNQTPLNYYNLNSYTFYYSGPSNSSLYLLDGLSFLADSDFDREVTLSFRAYYDAQRYVDGTLVLEPSETSKTTLAGDIRYTATYGSAIQINANDIARYYNRSYPGYSLQYVVLGGVPSAGSLYYNYYGASRYGSASRMQLTSSNYNGQVLYFSPVSTAQYALTELTYVPSGYNYCATIPFTAYGSSSRSVSGTILISVNPSAVSEVYGITQRNSSVTFPANSIYSAVSAATGVSLSGIQLLKLPSASQGTVYVGTGSVLASTDTLYGYSTGNQRMNQLRFVPASTFTGSVEIPYVAYNSSGTAFATGLFSLGVLSSAKSFKDVSSSTWCYKYVTELSDAGVIAGYDDGTFKPDSTVTYGAALKLIMLAAGYSEQAPVSANVFSGYLARAKADGIVTRSDVDLTKPITRLQVAQIAAGAMKLDTSNLSSVQPFTDTTDTAVRALNAAGIVEGYFNSGTSTYKPGNTLTRGQLSAIVWRMEQYGK